MRNLFCIIIFLLSLSACTQIHITQDCPDDHTQWQFTDISLSSPHLKKIQPTCVYEKLERTVAWRMAVDRGYSSLEAVARLKLSQEPWRIGKWTGSTMTVTLNSDNIPTAIALGTTAYWDGLQNWKVETSGTIVDSQRVLIGCYRTTTQDRTNAEWGIPYPVICMGAEITPKTKGYLIVTSKEPPNEVRFDFDYPETHLEYEFYGYDVQTKEWKYLGWPSKQAYSSTLIEDTETLLHIPQLHEQAIWDGAWLKETFGMSSVLLPEKWEFFSQESTTLLERMNFEYEQEKLSFR